MAEAVTTLLDALKSPDDTTLRQTGAALAALPPEATFALGDSLAERAETALQTALAGWLYAAGLRDPEGLSVYLAANAHILPVSTITAAGKALPEAG